MFPTASPYSPFFTSGLLSEPLYPPPPYQDPLLGARRGSLPTDSPARPPSSADSAAFYFTLQPKRDHIQYRSFLSLDLAESQSLRSASLKRKESEKSKRTSRSRLDTSSKYPTIPEVPSHLNSSPSPLRLRRSRDSLRTLPSPKPAPSLTLPDLPVEAQSPRISKPPRLPSLPPLPSLEIPVKPSYPSSSITGSRSSFSSKLAQLPQRISVLTSSTVSTRVKKINRSDALARLEGRSKSTDALPIKQSVEQRNFMSMSDDEDSDQDPMDFFEEDEDEKMGFTFIEPEDIVLPSIADLVVSEAAAHARKGSISSLASRRRRNKANRASNDWLPLKSFIDLRNDDESSRWSWRSFIEVANVV